MANIKLTVDVEGLELEIISRFQEGYFDDLEEGIIYEMLLRSTLPLTLPITQTFTSRRKQNDAQRTN